MVPIKDHEIPFQDETLASNVQLTLVDDAGNQLAAARLVGAAGRTVEITVERNAAGALLAYLFGRGRRRVVLESDDIRLPGRLTTEWNGHRRWYVELGLPRRPAPRT